MLSFEEAEHKPPIGLENRGKPWNSEQDEKLVALFKEGLSIREIAGIFKRGEKAIRIRLIKNGIDPDETVEGASSLANSNMPEHQTKNVANDTSKPKITCQSCKFARSGECFPQKEICTDYERAYDVPKDERKIHSKPMPRIGGLSFIIGFFVAIIFSLLTVKVDTSVNLDDFMKSNSNPIKEARGKRSKI